MKKLALAILPLILFSCINQSHNSEKDLIPEGFHQITYLIDTFANNQVFKELREISEVNLNNKGEIKSAVQTKFSFENQEGITENTTEIYSPEFFWQGWEFETIYTKYSEQTLSDTLITDGYYTLQYNENSQLSSVTQGGNWYQIHFIYDQHGQWTQATQHVLEERSGHITYQITKREIRYNNEPIKSVNPTYLTVNGVDIFKKENRSIADYYVLLQKAGIFIPDNSGGIFDLSNGYFEYQDDGTGGGVSTGQLALFKTNDGKDILAINGYYGEAVDYYYMSGGPPKFYLFENNLFTELTDIFPEVNTQMFFDSEYTGSVEGISTFFTLPQKGLTIRVTVDPGLEAFCNSLDINDGVYEFYKDICKRYSSLKRTSIDIVFDKVSGTFKIKN